MQLSAEGRVGEHTVRITKGLTLEAGRSTLEIAYLLEELAAGPAAALRRRVQLRRPARRRRRPLLPRPCHGNDSASSARSSTWPDAHELGLIDEWLGIDVGLKLSRPTGFWTFPIETVSQSEGGFELVHQSVVVLPHWLVEADADGRWSVTMHLSIDTSAAESRHERRAVALAGAATT